MKKLFILAALLIFGCSFAQQSQAFEPWGAGIYNGTTEPADYAIPGASPGKKMGTASCRTIMGIVNWGDCSLNTAMKRGKITKVTAADWEKKYIVIYGYKTLKVYGN